MRDYTIVADNALRLAWLRHHARLLYDVDPSGQLSAQLVDAAELIELHLGPPTLAAPERGEANG